jgi:cob(I)alamin adenosyltransferase
VSRKSPIHFNNYLQRFQQSLLKLDALISQYDALCDVLRELYSVAEETHECSSRCKIWHKNHNKMLKKLREYVLPTHDPHCTRLTFYIVAWTCTLSWLQLD